MTATLTTGTVLEFDAMVAELRRKGVPLDKAQAAAREALGIRAPVAETPRVTPNAINVDGRPDPLGGFVRNPNIDEDDEQLEVIDLFRAYGAVVRSTSQKRRSKLAIGIADLIVMFPTHGFALWWETKRQVGGEQRPDQAVFEADCRASGWTYRLGDRYDAARYLVNLGLAEGGDGPCGITPIARSTPSPQP